MLKEDDFRIYDEIETIPERQESLVSSNPKHLSKQHQSDSDVNFIDDENYF